MDGIQTTAPQYNSSCDELWLLPKIMREEILSDCHQSKEVEYIILLRTILQIQILPKLSGLFQKLST